MTMLLFGMMGRGRNSAVLSLHIHILSELRLRALSLG